MIFFRRFKYWTDDVKQGSEAASRRTRRTSKMGASVKRKIQQCRKMLKETIFFKMGPFPASFSFFPNS